MEKFQFLKKYTGIPVHDHETALYHFGTDYAECNVHIIRYLRKNTEETVLDYEKKYHAVIERGREENKKTSHRYAKKDEKALLNRMKI